MDSITSQIFLPSTANLDPLCENISSSAYCMNSVLPKFDVSKVKELDNNSSVAGPSFQPCRLSEFIKVPSQEIGSERRDKVSNGASPEQDDAEFQIELDESLLIKSALKQFFAKEYGTQEINLLLPNAELKYNSLSDIKLIENHQNRHDKLEETQIISDHIGDVNYQNIYRPNKLEETEIISDHIGDVNYQNIYRPNKLEETEIISDHIGDVNYQNNRPNKLEQTEIISDNIFDRNHQNSHNKLEESEIISDPIGVVNHHNRHNKLEIAEINANHVVDVGLDLSDVLSDNIIDVIEQKQMKVDMTIKPNKNVVEKSVIEERLAEKKPEDTTDFCHFDIINAFKCKHCQVLCYDKKELLQHYKNMHQKLNKTHVIKINTSEPSNHRKHTGMKSALIMPSPKCIVIENAPLFTCGSCKAEFIEENLYSHHVRECHENTDSCSKHETKEAAFDEKLKGCFKKQEESSGPCNEQTQNKSKKPVLKHCKERNLRCGMFGCYLKFSSGESLRSHQSCHDFQSYSKTNYICFHCQIEFSKWNTCCHHLWTEHGVDVDILHCNFCESFKATTMHQMSLHQQIHSDDKPFVCGSCNASFKQRSLLINHEHIHKTQAENKTSTWLQRTLCNVCNKWFSCYRSYLQHFETVHNKATNFSCPDCSYVTYRKSRLAEHMRTHNNPSAYTCQICDFSCADHNSIRRHRLKHLSSKHLRCPAINCSLETVYATFFRKHMKKKHSGLEMNYTCQFCTFTTTQMERYIGHCSEHEKSMVSELLNSKKRKNEDSTLTEDSANTRESFATNSTEESDESLSAFDNHFFLKKLR